MTTMISLVSAPALAVTILLILCIAVIALFLVDTIMSVAYFFKGNKSKRLSQDIAQEIMENNGLVGTQIHGGFMTFRFWNYSRKTKKLKLRKPFQYNRKNVYGMVSSACDAYNAVLIENKDPKRWAVRFTGVIAPMVMFLGVAAAFGILVALNGNTSSWIFASIVLSGFVVLASFLTVWGLVILRNGVVPAMEKGVQKGTIHEGDLKSTKFWFKIKIWVAVVTLIINTIELIMKIAEKAKDKNN